MDSIKKSLAFLVLTLFIVACGKDKYQNSEKETYHVGPNTYVGSKNCIDCHKDAFDEWQGSHHDLAMQVANESNVLGDFSDVQVQIDNVKYVFFKKNNDFVAKNTIIRFFECHFLFKKI